MSPLRLEAITHHAVARRMLDAVTLDVGAGECVAILGQPGSGRASLLRVIAGVEAAESGRILLDGRDITRLPARRRPIGLVFQQDPVFSHATVFEAVASAMPEAAAVPDVHTSNPARVQHLLGLVGLTDDAAGAPARLDAPKRRRLLVARTLAAEPRILLVGEGFGPPPGQAVDPRAWLREVQRALGLTMLLTARDAAEALALGDRILVLEQGRVAQIGTPEELRFRPASPAVTRSLGLPAEAGQDAVARPLPPAPMAGWPVPAAVDVVAPGAGLPARVLRVTPEGGRVRVELELLADRRPVAAEMPGLGGDAGLVPGTIIGVHPRGEPIPGGDRLN
jgi:ABC-type sulfate/molybdate transport systems ATPase subunit